MVLYEEAANALVSEDAIKVACTDLEAGCYCCLETSLPKCYKSVVKCLVLISSLSGSNPINASCLLTG